MQTFLPYADFDLSFACLDKKRLGNQVWREGLTLLGGGWKHHLASKMWRGHEYQLGMYCLAGVQECERRYERDYGHIAAKIWQLMSPYSDTGLPKWFGDEAFHASHRSNLLRKLPDWYGQFGWTEGADLPYVWPKLGALA